MKAVISNFSICKTHDFCKTLPTALIIIVLFSCNTYKIALSSTEIVELRQNIAKTSMKLIGVKYRYGGNTPAIGFDCSGFVQYVYGENGINLPRTSKIQSKIGTNVSLENTKAGDLIFFKNRGKINHVGIVVENKSNHLFVIHSTTSGGVKKDDVLNNKYWKKRITFAKDVIFN